MRKTFGGSPTPNQMITSGTSPRIGTARAAWMTGSSRSSPTQNRPQSTARNTPGRDAEDQALGHPLERDEQVGLQHPLGPQLAGGVGHRDRRGHLDAGEHALRADQLPQAEHGERADDAPGQPRDTTRAGAAAEGRPGRARATAAGRAPWRRAGCRGAGRSPGPGRARPGDDVSHFAGSP